MHRGHDLKQIAQQLRNRRQELQEEASLEIGELRNEFADNSWDDAGEEVDIECDEVSGALADHICHELWQINHALEMLQAGRYGYCEGCGCSISTTRLKVQPSATMCVQCQSEWEGAPSARSGLSSKDAFSS